MEIKLEDGDYVKAVDGTLKTVSGDEELLQEAKMRLFTRRGAFCYAPSFGSRLAELSPDAGQQAFVFAQEALAPMLPAQCASLICRSRRKWGNRTGACGTDGTKNFGAVCGKRGV